jgi:hypothetical protein
MQATRDEVEALLRQSRKNIRESQQIYRKLMSLKRRVTRTLNGLAPTRWKKAESRRPSI